MASLRHTIHPHQNTQHIKAHNTTAAKYITQYSTQYNLPKIHRTAKYTDHIKEYNIKHTIISL